MAQLTPRRITEPVIRAVTRAAGLPVLGRPVRSLSTRLYGIDALRSARLGATRPWTQPPVTSPSEEPDRS